MKIETLANLPIQCITRTSCGFLYVVTPVLAGTLTEVLVVASDCARLYSIACNDVVVAYKLRVKNTVNIGREDGHIVTGLALGAQPTRELPLELFRVERRATLDLLFAYNANMFSLMKPTTVNYVPQKEQ